MEKAVCGQFDHQCWCLFEGDTPVALCTVRYGKADSAVIGLVGMDPPVAGRRLGRRMIYSVLNILVDRGVKTVNVVTQGRNYAAQNLYQSVGFRTKTTQLWYHKWMDR